MAKTVFILGTGFIGGSVLQGLLDEIAALCRDDKKAAKLKSLGVRPVKGTLHDDAVIQKEASTADIVLHIATADDKPSIESILAGLEKRSKEKEPAILHSHLGHGLCAKAYLGRDNVLTPPFFPRILSFAAGVLTSPVHPKGLIFADKSQNIFDDEIPDDALHRQEDLTIKRAVDSGKLNAKISIILPPLIYGIGTGPFNRRSIQIPLYVKDVIKHKAAQLYSPELIWNNIHIKNLVAAYLTLLSHLELTSSRPPLYIIAETGEHTWGSLYTAVESDVKSRGLIPQDAKAQPKDEQFPETGTGTQSRSKSELLPEWGWKVEKLGMVEESVKETVQHMEELGEI
ncbi:hypothetical protein JCM11641_004946 [Rhodosporidiobolus odoratus]